MAIHDIEAACEKAVGTALKRGADEAEAYGIMERRISAPIERNDVKVCKVQHCAGIGLRVFKSCAPGFASVNSLQARRIDDLCTQAVRLASRSPSDPLNILPAPKKLRKVGGLYDPGAEGLGPEDVFCMAHEMLMGAREYDPRVTVDSGSLELSLHRRAVFNSLGVRGAEEASTFSYFVLGFATEHLEVGSFDYLYGSVHMAENLVPREIGRRLGERVVRALGSRKAESFKGTVVMDPYAIQPVISYMLEESVDANNVQKGVSTLAGKLGEEIASPILTVMDDGTLPGGVGSSSFDREGLPHTPLRVIEKGTLERYMHNTYTARKEGTESTGHAAGEYRNVPAISATNFSIEPGGSSCEELIAEVERGLLVTRFSGSSEIATGEFSGVVKGSFMIERGEIKHPLKETLIAGNVLELLCSLSGASRERERVGAHHLPFLRFEDVSVTSA
ncbi:MAG: TldD/PmbA family protein [Candidatus Thermoplasmatota archaeon]